MDSKLYELIDILIQKIDEEFILAGHPNTGQFQENLEGEIRKDDKSIYVDILGPAYGLYLSEGVPPEKVPYRRRKRGQGSGGTSKYITGLHNWVKSKLGISDERESLSIAFAIATRHSEEGFPIRNGELGSKFLEEVSKKYEKQINALVEEIYDEIINKQIKLDK